MPDQERTRPPRANTPAQAPRALAPAGRQAQLGNSAVQEGLAQQPGSSLEGGAAGAQTALREKTTNASLSVRGRLPKQALLGAAGGNEFRTEESTGFEVGVGRSGMWANFHPALLVRPGSFWSRVGTGGIFLSNLYFNFQTGKASLSVDTGTAGDLLDLFFDVKSGIEARFASAVEGAMPAFLRGGNYDPYTDPEVGQRLSTVMSALTSAFPAGGGGGGAGGGLLQQVTGPEMNARVNARAASMPISKGMSIKLKEGAGIDLTALLEGNMATALSKPALKELQLRTDGLTLEHETWGLLGGLDLHGITFGPDLSIRDLSYTLGAETGVGLLKLLGMAAQLHTGQDLGVRDVESPRMTALRAQIEADARVKIPEMLRAQVRALAGQMPGLPLGALTSGPKS